MDSHDFHSIYRHGFVRCAVCLPEIEIAAPLRNAERTIALAQRAAADHAAVIVFPELGLSAYSCEDLFHQNALLDAVLDGLEQVRDASHALEALLLVGAPLRFDGQLYNCAVAIHRGQLLGVTPKTYLPNDREYDETRYFSSAEDAVRTEVTLLGATVPFGADLLYIAEHLPGLVVHSELGADLHAPISPSTYAALGGATLLANLSASSATLGEAQHRRARCATHSSRCLAAHLYSTAGPGESTNDLAWDNHALIHENGALLAESERFAIDEQVITADIDLERLLQERSRSGGFSDSRRTHSESVRALRRISVPLAPAGAPSDLRRPLERFPYVPSNATERDQYCQEAYHIQVQGLAKRLAATGIERLVIGVSGGLDSTQALLVAAKTMDRLGLPRGNIYAYTLPGFATSGGTKDTAHGLMQSLGVHAREIDIRPSSRQMLQDIEHPFAAGEPVYDVTFENVQAGERTSHLFRLANHHNALVVGTGDMSELALGWATYGVGDHMSHYNVNASVPKTLIQHLIRWVIASGQFDAATNRHLQAVLDTEISPELVPGETGNEQPAQSTEATIGPYELQDFHIYYTTRYGLRPSKVAFLALQAWGNRDRGNWPDDIPTNARNEYDLATIKRWLRLFLYRFFQISQFKRTCVPNGPKMVSRSLSPRADWRAPSDAGAQAWLAELDANVPDR